PLFHVLVELARGTGTGLGEGQRAVHRHDRQAPVAAAGREADEPMFHSFTRRRMAVLLAVLIALFALVLAGRWLNSTKIGGQQPAEPFRIAGNFYYVGANDLSAFLITGPEGHVVLDGGYPSTAPMIMAS